MFLLFALRIMIFVVGKVTLQVVTVNRSVAVENG